MVRKLTTAAFLLALALSLTACGNSYAGTAAHRWTGTNAASQQWEIQRQSEQEGAKEEKSDGAYHADENGWVDGFHDDNDAGSQVKEDLKEAGQDLGDAAKNAGEAAKDAAEGAGNAAKDAAEDAGETAKEIGDAAKDAAQNAGDGVEDLLDGDLKRPHSAQ